MELSRGRTEQEAAPTRAASCRFSAPRTRRADGRHWRTQAAGASPDAALAKLLRAQMARSSASTQQHKHVKAADSR